MAMKNITDLQVLVAVDHAKQLRGVGNEVWPDILLAETTEQPYKVCFRCLERAIERGYLEYGTSVRSAWITDKGHLLLNEQPNTGPPESLAVRRSTW